MHKNPIQPFLDAQGVMILDGGLSTELELRGYDLNHRLWTARMIQDDPDALKTVHRAFLEAGADCIISSSYQASTRGLVEAGYSRQDANRIILTSYDLAQQSCDEYGESLNLPLKPIVAASIGPYGAYLADGSEYKGMYGLSVDDLVDFHRDRFELLAEAAELLAIETIPSMTEATALRQLISEFNTACWVSFSCCDGEHINDGTPIRDAALLFADLPQVIAVGVNCTHPAFISSLIECLNETRGDKEIVIYPNSGELFCSDSNSWSPSQATGTFEDHISGWYRQGARLIGGCCRITAPMIAILRQKLIQ